MDSDVFWISETMFYISNPVYGPTHPFYKKFSSVKNTNSINLLCINFVFEYLKNHLFHRLYIQS